MSALLTFLVGPVGRWILIVLAFLIWTAYQRDQAADEARNLCEAEQLQRTLEEVMRQRDAAQRALEEAEERAEQTQEEMAQLETERDRIIEDLQERGTTACVIPDDILERLRNIR